MKNIIKNTGMIEVAKTYKALQEIGGNPWHKAGNRVYINDEKGTVYFDCDENMYFGKGLNAETFNEKVKEISNKLLSVNVELTLIDLFKAFNEPVFVNISSRWRAGKEMLYPITQYEGEIKTLGRQSIASKIEEGCPFMFELNKEFAENLDLSGYPLVAEEVKKGLKGSICFYMNLYTGEVVKTLFGDDEDTAGEKEVKELAEVLFREFISYMKPAESVNEVAEQNSENGTEESKDLYEVSDTIYKEFIDTEIKANEKHNLEIKGELPLEFNRPVTESGIIINLLERNYCEHKDEIQTQTQRAITEYVNRQKAVVCKEFEFKQILSSCEQNLSEFFDSINPGYIENCKRKDNETILMTRKTLNTIYAEFLDKVCLKNRKLLSFFNNFSYYYNPYRFLSDYIMKYGELICSEFIEIEELSRLS